MKRGLGLLTIGGFVGTLSIAFAAASASAADWPSGPHYTLSILGGKACGSVPSGAGGGSRHTIFVPLTTVGDSPNGAEPESLSPDATDTSIYLIQGPTFAVCNGDACTAAVDCAGNSLGKTGAVFQLPCDVLSATGTTSNTCTQASVNSATYCVFAAALGKPGGQATATTCATDIATGDVVCSTNNLLLVRSKGGPKVQNATDALTTLTCAAGTTGCPCASGTCTFEIFNTLFTGFLWDYDNAGLKNAQVRFYLEPPGTTSCPTS
jgi:hypothetical protein